MLDMLVSLWDTDFDEMKEEKNLKEFQPQSNEYGDKIDKAGICQGVLLFLGAFAMLACAGVRGCQEIKKHTSKTQAKVIQTQNQR